MKALAADSPTTPLDVDDEATGFENALIRLGERFPEAVIRELGPHLRGSGRARSVAIVVLGEIHRSDAIEHLAAILPSFGALSPREQLDLIGPLARSAEPELVAALTQLPSMVGLDEEVAYELAHFVESSTRK